MAATRAAAAPDPRAKSTTEPKRLEKRGNANSYSALRRPSPSISDLTFRSYDVGHQLLGIETLAERLAVVVIVGDVPGLAVEVREGNHFNQLRKAFPVSCPI